jgi:predicted nicotinamide N-methyase|tara:strand:- start:20150 stop:20815 length:666 start_codon:yes stop_codon:yes gene_type:complete
MTLRRNLRETVSQGNIAVTGLPLCPEIQLYLLSADYPSGPLPSEEMLAIMAAPAYWSFCWASGQVLARYILDCPHLFADKRVVDFGSGSGVVAIAAAKVGAREVTACDFDPHALDAARANADLNNVSIDLCGSIEEVPQSYDTIIAADVLYDRDNHHYLEEFLQRARQVFVADSRMKGEHISGYRVVKQMSATTIPDINEFEEFNRVKIYNRDLSDSRTEP